MREAPSIVLLEQLIGAGARVRAHDPVAMEAARRVVPGEWLRSGQLELSKHQYDAVPGADALVLVTEWKPYRNPNFDFLAAQLKERIIFDRRNQHNPHQLRSQGFEYFGIGR